MDGAAAAVDVAALPKLKGAGEDGAGGSAVAGFGAPPNGLAAAPKEKVDAAGGFETGVEVIGELSGRVPKVNPAGLAASLFAPPKEKGAAEEDDAEAEKGGWLGGALKVKLVDGAPKVNPPDG